MLLLDGFREYGAACRCHSVLCIHFRRVGQVYSAVELQIEMRNISTATFYVTLLFAEEGESAKRGEEM